MSFFKRWGESLREFKDLRAVAFCGLMAALAIVLNYVASIDLGPYLRIGFSGVPNQVVSYLFGPAIGSIFGGVLDILKWMLKPSGSFFPGFTISAIAGGLIYGAFLYKRPLTIWRVVLAHLCVKVFVNIGLNTLWLVIMYNQVASVILPARLLSNAIMLPVDSLICWLILKMVDRVIRPQLRKMKAV